MDVANPPGIQGAVVARRADVGVDAAEGIAAVAAMLAAAAADGFFVVV